MDKSTMFPRKPENTAMNDLLELQEKLLFYAFRYALGRQTYAVSDVTDEMLRVWLDMTVHTRNHIKKEIRDYLTTRDKENPYGPQWNYFTTHWQSVLNQCEELDHII